MRGSYMAPPFSAPAEVNSPHLALLELSWVAVGPVARVVLEPQETSLFRLIRQSSPSLGGPLLTVELGRHTAKRSLAGSILGLGAWE